MLAFAVVAWFVTGLICVADVLERRRNRKTNVVELPKREPCNVVPLGVRRDNVRVLAQRRWGA